MLQSGDGLRALTGRRVAVVGAGPGGLAAALLLIVGAAHAAARPSIGRVSWSAATDHRPLVASFVLVWVLRLLGFDPDMKKSEQENSPPQ